MGRAVRDAAAGTAEIVASFDTRTPSVPRLPPGTDVLMDFSAPSAFPDLDRLVSSGTAALVSGTTGLGPAERALLEKWAGSRAVFHSPNMSYGVFMLTRLVIEAGRMAGGRFDLEIVEIHHRLKADSPSGTALRLLEAWKAGAGADLVAVHGRSGPHGPRGGDEAGIHAVRGGDVAGDHEVHLLGEGERIILTHRSSGRRTFALGALAAAAFVIGMPRGLYGMDDLAGWRGWEAERT